MNGDLERLAAAHGVAARYEDHRGAQREASPDTVRAVLAAMGVELDGRDGVEEALRAAAARPWRRLAPPSVVTVRGEPAHVDVRAPADAGVRVHLELEDGGARLLTPGAPGETRTVGGVPRSARTVELPVDLPDGYHRLRVEAGDEHAVSTLVVAPPRCPRADDLPNRGRGGTGPHHDQGRGLWGWMLQLYALRSKASWGIGDLADLKRLIAWSAERGADFVLCNPLHAPTPVLPIEPSPYYPSSRRFTNPLYVRIEALPELEAAPSAVQRRVGRLAEQARGANRRDRIERDGVWRAKAEALELLRGVPVSRERRAAHEAFRAEAGSPLQDFATFCALAERHGPRWREWPERLRHPSSVQVAAAREDLADRVAFHSWVQFVCDDQLALAQSTASAGGMSLGVLADLAVGVSPDGADAWALQDELATAVTVGAPPDAFNQRGQDWQLPPLRPDRLVETGFEPLRQLIAPALRHAGGIRIDHVLGLFRLWWIPEGAEPADGCYVRYPARDVLAVLALEASRAGDALVVGEDLGTVADEVREQLDAWGVVGSRVAYFERTPRDHPEPERRLRADEYPERVLASVTTHDLPTVAGWWADEDVRVQAELGLLGEGTTLAAEGERKAAERAEMVDLLCDAGVLDPGSRDDPAALREALHAFLARTSAGLVAAQPADAVGDLRQPNQPGTIDEYPNWRLPLAEPTPTGHRPVLLDELLERDELARLAQILADGRAP